MKRLAIAGVLALGLLACSQQRASAWCKFCWTHSGCISWESSGHCWSFSFNCYSPPCPSGGYGFSGFGGYPAYDGHDGLAAYPGAAPAATAPSSTFTAPKPTPATGTPSSGGSPYYGTQPVSYSYYGQGAYGYGGYGPGTFQAPSYWYDR
jgi:hypothetical protein